ncbi:MAG TPA: helix-turn-helix transcriptional regulator [Longimicrobiales bacterium]|nr:helix-turn-helix transcriptional regulator [Longimicrobiales bacterium]
MEINKDLIAASSTPIVLAILAEGDSYGYAILQRVRELSGGAMEWTDGMLYPVLHRLERQGHVEARWETAETGRRRKYYQITQRGRSQLAEERRQWQAVDATLRGIWGGLSLSVPTPRPVARALLWIAADLLPSLRAMFDAARRSAWPRHVPGRGPGAMLPLRARLRLVPALSRPAAGPAFLIPLLQAA